MLKRILGALLLLVLLTYLAPSARAGSAVNRALAQARDYLLETERNRGTLSPWSYVALAVCGEPLSAARVGRTLQSLEGQETTTRALLILTLLAAGQNPSDYQGRNLVAELAAAQLPSGKFADHLLEGGERLVNAHLWAILALKAAGEPLPRPEAARRWLIERQHPDGSFHWDALSSDTADVDTTGMALMALAALGETPESPAVQKAVEYLKTAQLPDGAFSSWGAENAESCSAVILGLVALGLDPQGADFRKPEGDPVTALLRFQLPGGAFEHVRGGGANEMATQQALLALAALLRPEVFRSWLLRTPVSAPTSPTLSSEGFQVRFRLGRNHYTMIREGREESRQFEPGAAPFVQDGRTLVPVRFLALALGVPEEGIRFEAAPPQVTLIKGHTRLTLLIGRPLLLVNGQLQALDVAPVVRNGRTYLPARYVAEGLGCRVTWEPSRGEIVITAE